MRPNYLTPLAASLAIILAPSVKAAEEVLLQTESFNVLKQQFQFSLPGTAKAALTSPETLQFIKQYKDENQVTHIRMQQKYSGFDVYGGYVILHGKRIAKNLLTTQNEVQVNGRVYRDLQNELGQPTADLVKNADLALEQFKGQFAGLELSEGQVKPIVYIDEAHKAHWAYRVSVFIQHYDRIPERPSAIIDAKNYTPFLQWDDIKTANLAVKGMGYGGNTKTGQYIFDGQTFPLLDITRNTLLRTCYMENTAVKVVDMKHGYASFNSPMKFSCKKNTGNDKNTFWTGYQGDGYDKENGAFSPMNDAMYSGYVIKRMYKDWYGIEVLTEKSGIFGETKQPMQLIMRVHYGSNYENAYWDGKQMTFGDGDDMMYPLVSLEIGAHEVSHGFTEQHANLEYVAHSGGINESFSDMAAKAAEFYSTQKNTWTIGADIVKEGSGMKALRYMDQPSRDGESIDSADKYTKGLDVHFSSGVFNRLFYLISSTNGWNAQLAFKVMVKANMAYWQPTTTFAEAGCGVLNATNDFKLPLEDVKAALRKVAIDPDTCPALINS
ncbi:Zinc metalloproteinase precursor [Legionella massiliensis]|uniref:Neutral metalloproteinase n=1 Tax=Legionella massiliensis TaxID=1034943 RepID=A0A078KUM6_9GAMM|nr:M4 family metallopeptidase [Legionella massiliensis]CDZ76746.1 Zinc metalloproteinase precursor [Legionella massiliensis]CEE12484.1 Zinc metalloproteinase precursor [Legionella massiliensis]